MDKSEVNKGDIKMITDIEKNRIENSFKERCISLNIKYKTKKFYEEQASFFCGASIALNINLPIWTISIMSGREIIEKY